MTTCGWFALCTNDAVTVEYAAPLGLVPICRRCADKVTELREGMPA